MIQFLESERIGRFATIDKNGFPFIVPMNFVFFNEPGVVRTMADDGQTVEWLELTIITAARWSIITRDWFLQTKSLYCNSDICLERRSNSRSTFSFFVFASYSVFQSSNFNFLASLLGFTRSFCPNCTTNGRACSICSECILGITSDKSLTDQLLTE
jgi:hypothetical protein